MYITTDTIITAATLIGALGVIGGTIVAIYKFYQKPAKLEKKLENLQKTHDEDIRKINEELIKREPLPAPKFWLNPEVKDFYEFTPDDVRLDGYETHPQIKNIPIAV